MKKYNITVNGATYEVLVEEVGATQAVPTPVVVAQPVFSAPVAAPAAAPAPAATPAPAAAPAAAPQAQGATQLPLPCPELFSRLK